MKAMTVAEVKKSLAETLRNAQEEEIIVTKHGRPIVRIRGVSKKESASYWEMLAERLEGPSIAQEEVRQELGIPKPSNLHYKYPRKRTG